MGGTILLGMARQLILYSFTCGPALLMFAAWLPILRRVKRQSPTLLGVIALAVATANAVLAACTVLYYEARPAPYLPPWKDPEIMVWDCCSYPLPSASRLPWGPGHVVPRSGLFAR